jgi:hypothetical protein
VRHTPTKIVFFGEHLDESDDEHEMDDLLPS